MLLPQWRPRRQPRTILPALLIPLLALALIAGSLAVYFTDFAHAAPVNAPVAISGNVPALVASSKVVGLASARQQLSLSIELRLRNEAMLKNYVTVISNPKSASYHHYLTQAQLQAVFSPAPATYAAMQQYLRQSGFTITQTYTHRLLIDFSGTVGLAEQVFHVQINRYVSAGGKSFYANATNPLLPPSLAPAVQLISGLSDDQRWSHAPLPVSPHRIGSGAKGNNKPALFCPGPVYQGSYFTPGQVQTGYNLSGLYSEGDHGEGQTVALFELDTFQMSDLTNYEACYDQKTRTHIYTIPIDGGPPSPPQGDQGPIEVELDAEMVLSAAPALGQLRIYEASDFGSLTPYNDEWAQILRDNPPVISTSWGECENDLGFAEAQVEYNDFLFAAAQGETVYAASGDTGSSGCYRDFNQSTILNAGDPAAQPYVTGVGGTTLALNRSNQYSGETAWNDPPVQGFSGGASGGGISQFWTEDSSWLSAPGVQNQYSTGTTCNAPQGQICRETPDVSLNADPYVGYLVYCTVSQAGCSSNDPWLIVGGTSAAAPLWAAMTALANEQSLKEGGFTMGWITSLLYDVASNGTQYANDFHDITSGSNDYNGYQSGRYPATSDYDLASGLGSFNATNLAADMISYNGQRAATPANTEWYFAEGSVGGGFQEYLTLQNPGSQAASVSVQYLEQGHGTVVKTYPVGANTRSTVNVNTSLGISPSAGHVSLAAIVSSNVPIVAERPLYFNFHGIASGTDVVGATSPQQTYYFPYGNTTQSGSTHDWTYVTMLNPSSTQTATVTLTYYTGSCNSSTCPSEVVSLKPLSRATASPSDESVSGQVAIAVSSTAPIVAERPLYVNADVPNAGQTPGAASEVGASSAGTTWLFAEGYTATGFQEYLNLANFGSVAATATINLEYTNGDVRTQQVTVGADTFTQFDVNTASGSCTPSPCNPTTSVSAQVTATQPIVVDRLMYFRYGGKIPGITETVGTPTASSIYAFAEGYTAGQFTTFLTLQNPTNTAETVAVTLFTGHGLILQELVVVDAHSRSTLNINNILNPIGPDSVSMVVQALENGAVIVAERPEYFNYSIPNTSIHALGATDVIGYTGS